MGAPWEKYQSQDAPAAAPSAPQGPWSKYQAQAPAQAAPQSQSLLDTQLPFGTTPRGIIQGGLNALPVAGGIAGAIAGSPADLVTGPTGTVVGAGMGYAGGTALKKAGEQFLLGQNHTPTEVLKDTALAVPDGMAQEMGGQLIGKGLSAAANTSVGKAVIGKAGDLGARVGEALTGVPKQEIKTFAQSAPEIQKLSAENDHSVQDIADSIRGKVNDIISAHKADLNGQISKALADKTGSVESQPIIDELNAAKAKINSKLRPDEIGEVDDLIGKVRAVAGDDGKISLQDAHDLKEYLSEQAKGTYQKSGQMFQRGEKAAQAAKSGAAATRSALNAAAPDVAEANGSLSRLHDIEDVMNRNLLAEGKTASPLLAAGAGTNEANAKILKQLGNETGTDVLGEAQKLAAARTFGKPQVLPQGSTGKIVGHMGFGGGTGLVLGGLPGAVIGAAATSPQTLKVAINAGRAAASPTGQALAGLATKAAIGNAVAPQELAPEVPTKGPDKWMNDGVDNLLTHAPDDKDTIQKAKGAANDDPKVKQLLIQASDLKPGSKALGNVLTKLKTRLAGADE